MDFSYLLDLAKQNEEHAKEAIQVKRYSTQVSSAKKDPRPGVKSQAVQAFLSKKEHEDRKKKLEDKKKKEMLLSLRSKDRKSNARVQAMLNRTKAASKAVLDDAKNSGNTAITVKGLAIQPDEDDYGYVSHEASEFYKKLLNKYSSEAPLMPKDNQQMKGKTKHMIDCVKSRDTNAVQKTDKQLSSLGKQKQHANKSVLIAQNGTDLNEKIKSSTKDGGTSKKTMRSKVPPPEAVLSFDQILKLAATKQHEPIKFEKKAEVSSKKDNTSERLMTQKEREDLERKKHEERERQLRKTQSSISHERMEDAELKKNTDKPPTIACTTRKSSTNAAAAINKPQSKAPKVELDLRSCYSDVKRPVPESLSKSQQPSPSGKQKYVPQAAPPVSASKRAVGREVSQKAPHPASRERVLKGKSLATSSNVRSFPPHKDFRPADRYYKRPIESDEEEDSDLDDFIDDGPEGESDYSKHIREIFGYDRNKYRRIESDDEEECMESSFAQQMKEECISTKIGIMEDLEEERRLREEEERKKKLLKKTSRKK